MIYVGPHVLPDHVEYRLHDPKLGDHGTDMLLTVTVDGTHTVSTRPGAGREDLPWTDPAVLTPTTFDALVGVTT